MLESIDDIKNNKILLFENMKNKILNYKILDIKNIFHLTLRFKGSYDISFDLDFEIIRKINNFKIYTLKILVGYNSLVLEEIYEENIKKEKYLIGYKDINLLKYNSTFFSSLDTLNQISVVIPNDEIVENKFIEFFNVNKNNYSLRSLFIKLNNNINVGDIFKNIDKFRVLKSFVVKDSIKNKNNLLNLVENISKIHTIERLMLFYLAKLSSEEQKNISQIFSKYNIYRY